VPIVCNDGITIAKEFDLKDPEENLGARMLRQAAEKTEIMVGDGNGDNWRIHTEGSTDPDGASSEFPSDA
jgi:hypothetical protein